MQQVLDEAQVPASRVLGAGAAVPGPVDPATGSVARSSMIPSWAGTVIREELENVFAYPLTVDNDSNCAALAEMRWGAGRGYRNVVYLKLHSGIGGAIILNGELLHGNSGRAGEFGHITLDPRGPLCGCGNRGCLETYAGIPALLEQARPSYGPQLTLTELLQLARRGDAGCRRLLTDTGHLVGQALGSLWNTLDPEVIIIGGALSRAQELLLEPARDGFLRTALSPGTGTESRILMGTLGGNASALGAVVSFFKGIVEMA